VKGYPLYLALALACTSLQAKESLVNTLDVIGSHTGTKFHLSDSLRGQQVDLDASSGNWAQISENLMRNFNRVELADPQGNKDIYLLAVGTQSVADAKNNSALQYFQPEKGRISSNFSEVNPDAIRLIAFDKKRLLAMRPGDQLTLTLPGESASVVLEEIALDSLGNTNWTGHIEGDDLHQVMLTFGEDGVFGRIYTPDSIYRIETRGTGTYMIDTSIAGLNFPDQSTDGVELPEQDSNLTKGTDSAVSGLVQAAMNAPAIQKIVSQQAKTPAAPKPVSTTSVTTTTVTSTTTRVDVLVLYTAGVSTTRISNLVSMANNALKKSTISMQINPVAVMSVAYTGKNANNTALNDLTLSKGAFATVGTLRTQYKADLVTLIRPFDYATQASCGVGWVNGGNGSAFNKNYAFSVVSDGVSGQYYCSDYTFAHELGHNMGSTHDRAHSSSPGHFDYSYGYGMPNSFGTVMSYYWPDAGVFSSPSLICKTSACGVDASVIGQSADNVRSLNNVRQNIADLVK